MANVRFCELQDIFVEGLDPERADREDPQFTDDSALVIGSYALEHLGGEPSEARSRMDVDYGDYADFGFSSFDRDVFPDDTEPVIDPACRMTAKPRKAAVCKILPRSLQG